MARMSKHLQNMVALYCAVDGIQDALTYLHEATAETTSLEVQLINIYESINQMIDKAEATHKIKQAEAE